MIEKLKIQFYNLAKELDSVILVITMYCHYEYLE